MTTRITDARLKELSEAWLESLDLVSALEELIERRAAEVATPAHVVVSRQPVPQCSLEVGCDEAGICYAMANGCPDQCGAPGAATAEPRA